MHTRAIKNTPRQQRGFSLIEVLIAMLVLAIGLLGMAQMQSSGIRSTHGAYLRTQATLLAGDMLDSMRANQTAARNGSYDINFVDATPAPGGTIANRDLNLWLTNLNALLPGGDGQISTVAGATTNNPSDITIAVSWSGLRQSENGGAATTKTFTVDTTL